MLSVCFWQSSRAPGGDNEVIANQRPNRTFRFHGLYKLPRTARRFCLHWYHGDWLERCLCLHDMFPRCSVDFIILCVSSSNI